MKVAILGYSGSGKSTLARRIGENNNIPVMHFDMVQWLPGWECRTSKEKENLAREFLDSNESWVIDGNYKKIYQQRRLEEADEIILMLFSRLSCMHRVKKRLNKYRGTNRPDMTVGCNEKIDFEFVKWIFIDGRTKAIRDNYKDIQNKYSDKIVIIKNQKQLDKYISEKGMDEYKEK